jgi:hypothetical protein
MSVCDLENTLTPQGKGALDITVHVKRVCFAWATPELFNIINKAMFMFIHRSVHWSVMVDFKNFDNS